MPDLLMFDFEINYIHTYLFISLFIQADILLQPNQILIHHLISTTAAGKSFWFGFKSKAHS
jgi:hypothetical protein